LLLVEGKEVTPRRGEEVRSPQPLVLGDEEGAKEEAQGGGEDDQFHPFPAFFEKIWRRTGAKRTVRTMAVSIEAP
jgi:hypothetical protein